MPGEGPKITPREVGAIRPSPDATLTLSEGGGSFSMCLAICSGSVATVETGAGQALQRG